ncbi:DUF3899 domain-containing protein [Planococcus lenghuensis]|uniref:DUF3899 domain-containing protein n=1 Tax=Planococcus lenghuensis TaxID=2213202 RepID=A0A1Q2L314_9BACL|nr:DUF3899 domain-containing protein [Planococcus lenghuensis]AQQ54806.1 hypothetical protein B0X71_17995 [Planococcus lenghuensis]
MKPVMFWILSLPLLFGFGRLLADPFGFMQWLDLLFASGLLLLMAGGALAVLNGGFFSAFTRSWQTFFSALNKREHIIREAEGRSGRSAPGFQRRTFSPVLLIGAGFAYCLVSFILSFLLVY